MAEVCLGIASNLDIDAVLQGVIEGARTLTGARYGALVSFDDSGGIRDLVTSGMTLQQREDVDSPPKGLGLLGYLNEVPKPLRLHDITSHPRSVGFPANHPPMKTFLGAPIRHLGEPVGNIYLTEKEGGREFTTEDEDTLVLFAAQAAMAIANALSHRAEQQARADLEALINISPVGVVVFDAKTGELISANEETRRIVGKLNAPGRTIDQLLEVIALRRTDGRNIPPDELPTAKALRNGETVLADEIVIHLPGGRAITTLVNARPIYGNDREVVSVVATIQDVTPLEEIRKQRAEFLGMVSHELRTPLAAVKGSAASMLNSPYPLDPVETRQFLRIIDEEADHMRHLINDLVDMTHIEAGTLPVTPEPTDVGSLLDQARESYLREGTRNNSIEINLAPDLPRVMVERRRIFQVIVNLLARVSERSPESSGIRVNASVEDPYVAVCVEGEDRGVPAGSPPHVFRKFSIADQEDMARRDGRDFLRLAISRGIVEAHGGRILAEDGGPGHGDRFTVTVPLADETPDSDETRTGQTTAHPRDPGRESTRVLVVDEEPEGRRYISSTLSEAEFTPVATGNPDELERLVESEQPHVVLFDLTTPWTNEPELMNRVIRISDAPVIFVSGQDVGQSMEHAFELGAADFLVKPFTRTELVARIKATLRRRVTPGHTGPPDPFLSGDLAIDYARRLVTVAGREVRLTATEYKLLFELSTAAGRVLTHKQLLRLVWGPLYESDRRGRAHLREGTAQ